MHHASVFTLTAAGMVALICAIPAAAEDQEPNLLPDTEAFRFNTKDRFYEKRKYSDDFRMKGIEIRRNVYFGEAKIAGEKGPGIVVEHGKFTWGFNHQAAEIQLRF